jgi:hypothetical protein
MGVLAEAFRVKQNSMMQQQREGEKQQYIYRYDTLYFWLFRIAMRLFFFTSPLILFYFFAAKEPTPMGVLCFSPMIFWEISEWQSNWREEKWMWQHKNTKIIVNCDGIEWHQKNKVIQIKWDEIVQTYVKDDIYVIVKKGVKEEEICFLNTKYLRDRLYDAERKKYNSPFTSLTTIINKYSHIRWEQIKECTTSKKASQNTYPFSKSEVFSYDNPLNYFTIGMAVCGVASLALFFSVFCIRAFPTPHIAALFTLIPVVSTLTYYLWHWQWHRKSQIETDDLGIALIEPKGITWRVLWFALESYMPDGRYGILKTKDGKTYKSPLNTAKKEDIEAEIRQRIKVG